MTDRILDCSQNHAIMSNKGNANKNKRRISLKVV